MRLESISPSPSLSVFLSHSLALTWHAVDSADISKVQADRQVCCFLPCSSQWICGERKTKPLHQCTTSLYRQELQGCAVLFFGRQISLKGILPGKIIVLNSWQPLSDNFFCLLRGPITLQVGKNNTLKMALFLGHIFDNFFGQRRFC